MQAKKQYRQEILARLKPLGKSTYWHGWLRLRTFPFESILKAIPRSGLMVDSGCGFGFSSFMASRQYPRLKVVAFDPDEEKIKVASRLLESLPHVTVTQSFARIPKHQANAVVLLDVLYLVPTTQKKKFLENLGALLKRNGLLLLSFVPQERTWRYWLAFVQERVMVNLAKRTYGTKKFVFEKETELKQLLSQSGFRIQTVVTLPTPRPFFHKHRLIVARKSNSIQ